MRSLMVLSVLIATSLGACSSQGDQANSQKHFVQVEDGQFVIDDAPYRFAGVNFWYGAYLGADTEYGDIERLKRELDMLKSIGVDNLRVLGSSEKSPHPASLSVTFRDQTDVYNEALLKGLDVLLAEMGKRDMKAVIYLNNFWEWSGGMTTYLHWTEGVEVFPPSGDPDHPWPAYPVFTKAFYKNLAANALFLDYVDAVLTRTNTITGQKYKDDTAIMSWQLANEPRAGAWGTETDFESFYSWIDDTAAFIKQRAPHHLVSSGNEGFMGCAEEPLCFYDAHDTANIDYLTFHMWPKNWGWLSDEDIEGTFDLAIEKADAYMEMHIADAALMNKPLVLEEFGLPRSGGSFLVDAGTGYRDLFFNHVYSRVEASAAQNGPFAGTNIWSWGGFGRAQHADGVWHSGDTSYVGDPPQEPQGLNSVFNIDDTTIAIIKSHSERLLK